MPDGERKHGKDDVREANNRKLKDMLDERGVKYVSLSGSYPERLEQAMGLVDGLFA
jgi:HTH-type transcriptional repressor of NAD biosynthesis genes